ncbi:hypothetical protein TREMEDRAFT_34158 [Tremella mesenterica DSM 1558]|uniref:uncharacterized protein n=1 Tax=Tremella mesenterica (strain ATCC 24925 / CBS 8224 / DSM 1558 / NBRC 9311 / NRRL Y-6157 / RJB 2259-6 / UBC 559-6) TaxID=578456 RepID=UPI0003F48E68|nr:uncharacterized protein TREMEDRAFT_34158 [Tremella mesenterica DSM 1558]EIW67072.1 hypothetical protein TREMEDRAFT_34158 [Tremella mesenterica DSM 1558]
MTFVANPTISTILPTKPYILSIVPSPISPHLFLRHPSSDISIIDSNSLSPVGSLSGGHGDHVTQIVVGENGGVWSSGKEGGVVRWDERGRRVAMGIKAFIRKPLSVSALAVAERDHLVIGGTELVSSEAHIIFWDTRNTSSPIYTHSSTHSDDITHLSLLPPSTTFLPSHPSHPTGSLPERLLLSTSTDGLVALTDYKESDEDEAVKSFDNWGQSFASASFFLSTHSNNDSNKGERNGEIMKIWGRSDMDSIALWDLTLSEEGIELINLIEHHTSDLKYEEFDIPTKRENVVRSAQEEIMDKKKSLKSDYVVDVIPSLGVSKEGQPVCAVGTNEGDLIILHQPPKSTYKPSAFLRPLNQTHHQDVIRAIYHDPSSQAIYTGSEDGVVCAWAMGTFPRVRIGDPDVDEVETDEEEDSEDGMDVDSDIDDDSDPQRPGSASEVEESRYGPVLGGRANERKERRHAPY